MDRDLVELAHQEDWDQFVFELEARVSTEGSSFRGLRERDMEGPSSHSSILHVVCSVPSVPVGVVDKLLMEAPELVVSLDDDGQTPLHVAVSCSCPSTVVRSLVRSRPQMALEKDYALLRPIDILCRKMIMVEELSKYPSKASSGTSPDSQLHTNLWDCVQILAVAMGPAVAGVANSGLQDNQDNNERDWDSPTLHACLRAIPNDFPYFLLERSMTLYQFAKDYKTGDRQGNLPLHIVAAQPPPEEEDEDDYNIDGLPPSSLRRKDSLLMAIARKFPLAARTRNHDGQLPLDVAIQGHVRGWNTGIEELLELYPTLDRFSIPVATNILALTATTPGRTSLLFEMLRCRPEFFTYGQNM